MSNNKISKVLTGAIVSAMLSGGAAFAQESASKSTDSKSVSVEKKESDEHTAKGKNGCNGPNGCGKKHSKKEKNGCSGPNGCGKEHSK